MSTSSLRKTARARDETWMTACAAARTHTHDDKQVLCVCIPTQRLGLHNRMRLGRLDIDPNEHRHRYVDWSAYVRGHTIMQRIGRTGCLYLQVLYRPGSAGSMVCVCVCVWGRLGSSLVWLWYVKHPGLDRRCATDDEWGVDLYGIHTHLWTQT